MRCRGIHIDGFLLSRLDLIVDLCCSFVFKLQREGVDQIFIPMNPLKLLQSLTYRSHQAMWSESFLQAD